MLRTLLLTSMLMLSLTACSGEPVSPLAELPQGDPANGAQLYERGLGGAPSCIGCHVLEGQALAGPNLGNYAAVAGERVEGQSAAEYTYNSIVNVDDYLVEGYGNLMYANYGTRLNDQQLADIMAYLLTLDNMEN